MRIFLFLSLALTSVATQIAFAGVHSDAFSPSDEIEISVRDEETTEIEFQALARAHGHSAFSERILKSTDILVSHSANELFDQRLVDAQSVWLKKDSSSSAIDHFLALEPTEDWPEEKRKAFRHFRERRGPKEFRAATAGNDAPRFVFPTLPEDVVLVLVNGEPVSRYELPKFDLPNGPTRVTLISNVFHPTSITLGGAETRWPPVERKRWINEDCSIHNSPGLSQTMKLVALGVGRCSLVARNVQSGGHKKEGVDFGFSKGATMESEANWPEPMPAPSPNVFRRPWFWGVVGAVAIGAAIAIERSQNQTMVRPNHSETW